MAQQSSLPTSIANVEPGATTSPLPGDVMTKAPSWKKMMIMDTAELKHTCSSKALGVLVEVEETEVRLEFPLAPMLSARDLL